ncbi:sm-like protein LSM4 [Gossypium australe]|uniref:Sm-like protein LSM4 n=1 Tax=Gossypium australe TaxID=47621 RepID=A0A5B6WF64_9ROSI|nr:sm-like protein LSM4 [Gossypium australe]
MLVELKTGETYNGHLVNCDTWMTIHLREVICTSKVIDKVQEETKSRADRKLPGVSCGRGRDREDGLGGRQPKGARRGLNDGAKTISESIHLLVLLSS